MQNCDKILEISADNFDIEEVDKVAEVTKLLKRVQLHSREDPRKLLKLPTA